MRRMAPAQWTPTAHFFTQHIFSQVADSWRQGRDASFHLKSLNNGQAEISLVFWLPHPIEIIPPPSPYPTSPPFLTSNSRRPGAPTPRPIIPLFPTGQASKLQHRKSPVKQPVTSNPAPQTTPQPPPRKHPWPSSPLDLPHRLREEFNLQSDDNSSSLSPQPAPQSPSP